MLVSRLTFSISLQIDRQLQTYLQRVEAVLGKGWESHVEGQKLKQDGDSFRQKLNTQQLFDDWKKKVEARQLVVQGRIFNIVSQRTRTGTILKLQVNFTPETITLAKEVCVVVGVSCGYLKVCCVCVCVVRVCRFATSNGSISVFRSPL